jgi:hypothetical protein
MAPVPIIAIPIMSPLYRFLIVLSIFFAFSLGTAGANDICSPRRLADIIHDFVKRCESVWRLHEVTSRKALLCFVFHQHVKVPGTPFGGVKDKEV